MSSSCQHTFLGKLHRAPSKHRLQNNFGNDFFSGTPVIKFTTIQGATFGISGKRWILAIRASLTSVLASFSGGMVGIIFRCALKTSSLYLFIDRVEYCVTAFCLLMNRCRILRNFKLCQLVQNSVT